MDERQQRKRPRFNQDTETVPDPKRKYPGSGSRSQGTCSLQHEDSYKCHRHRNVQTFGNGASLPGHSRDYTLPPTTRYDQRGKGKVRYWKDLGKGSRNTQAPYCPASPTRERTRKKRKLSHNMDCRKKRKINFSKPEKLQNLLKLPVGHQVSHLVNNPYMEAYLKSSSSDFTSVSCMIQLFDNTLFCQYETLRKRVEREVLSEVLSNRGFFEAVRYHLCRLPGRANDKERANSVLFIK